MKKRTITIISIIFILLALAIGAFVLRSNSDIYSPSIELTSEYPGRTLNWNNKQNMESILTELNILNSEIKDLKSYELFQINKLKIIYTSQEQKSLSFSDTNNRIITGGSYQIDDKTLILKIYVNDELVNDELDIRFNQEVVQFLVALSLVPKSSTGSTSTTFNERMGYFLTVIQNHLQSSQDYPIKIV